MLSWQTQLLVRTPPPVSSFEQNTMAKKGAVSKATPLVKAKAKAAAAVAVAAVKASAPLALPAPPLQPAVLPAPPVKAAGLPAASSQAPVVVKQEQGLGGRPSSGASRAAQQAFQTFRNTKRGKEALQGMSNKEVHEYRRKWIIDRAQAENSVTEKTLDVQSNLQTNESGWHTLSQIADLEKCTIDAAKLIVAGLPSQQSRHAHLRHLDEFTEFHYSYAKRAQDTRRRDSTMEAISMVPVENDDLAMIDQLHAELGMDDVVPSTQPCPAMPKAGSSSAGSDAASLPAPPAAASAAAASAEAAGDDEQNQEGKLKKIEATGNSLLKTGRDLLRASSQILEKKPYLEGKLPFSIAQHI